MPKKKGLNWTEEEYREFLRKSGRGEEPAGSNPMAREEKPSKYHVGEKAERHCNGILFASVKEMEYYKDLQLLIKGGELKFFLRQVPFDLPGGVKYRVDFVEFHPDGSVRFVDVKGVETDMFKVKKKQVEVLYPVKIEIV
jgi:hypothetical protein